MPDEVNRELFEIVVEGQQAQQTLDKVKSGMVEIDTSAAKAGVSLDETLAKLGKLSPGEQARLQQMKSFGMEPRVIAQTMEQLRMTDQAQKNVGASATEAKQAIQGMGRGAGGAARQMGVLDRATRSVSTSWVRYMAHFFGAYALMRMARNVIRDWTSAHEEMDNALADFSWRVSSTGAAVDAYSEKLRAASMATGAPIAQVAGPLAQRAGAGELTRAAAAQQIFGGDTQYWLREGTANLDAYTAGMRIAGATTEEFGGVVQYASEVGEMWNISTRESIGLVSGLMDTLALTDREALGLTKDLSKLYDQNQALMRLGAGPAVVVGPGGQQVQRPLTEVMADISRLPQQAQLEIARLIGVQDQLFLDAVQGWGSISQTIQTVTNDTEAFNQAYGAMSDSVEAKTNAIGAAWDNLLSKLGDTQLYKNFLDGIRISLEGWAMVLDEIGAGLDKLKVPEEYAREFEHWTVSDLLEKPTIPPSEKEKAEALGLVPTAGAPTPTGPAAWQAFTTQRLPEGINIDQAVKEMERIISEEFVGVYETATGELVEVTRSQIDAERKLTLVLDEQGRKPVDVYGPAWQQALQNLSEDLKEATRPINLERLRDITPAQFDIAMRTRLPYWESRLAEVPGFKEEPELQNFFVGQNDIARQQLSTQTAMQYTLQDILDTEKKQLEGQWNIPAGAIMRVPLQSLDMLRWMQGAGEAGAPTGGTFAAPGLEPVKEAGPKLISAGQVLSGAGAGLTGAAASLSDVALKFGAKTYGGVPVEPGVAKEAAREGDVVGLQPEKVRPIPLTGRSASQAATKEPEPVPLGPGMRYSNLEPQAQAQTHTTPITISVKLDGREVARVVDSYQTTDLQNASRGRVGGIRP